MAGTQTWGRLATTLALCGGAGAALLLLLAGPGTRLGWWHYRTGLGLLRYSAWLSIAAAGIAVL